MVSNAISSGINLKNLTNVLTTVQDLLTNIFYSGVGFVDKPFIKKLDMVFQQVVKANHSRLAVNLRYIRVELDRFISDHKIFSVDRFMFFMNQAWLITNRTLLLMKDENKTEELLFLMRNLQSTRDIPHIKARLIGVQLHHLKDSVSGFTFYFISLSPEIYVGIFSIDLLKRYQASISVESMLITKWNAPFFPDQLFFYDIELLRVKLLEKTQKILLTDESSFKICKTQKLVANTKQAKHIQNLIKSHLKSTGPGFAKKKSGSAIITAISGQTNTSPSEILEKTYIKALKTRPVSYLPYILDLEQECMNSEQKFLENLAEYKISPLDTVKSFNKFCLLENVTYNSMQKTKKEKNATQKWECSVECTNIPLEIAISIDAKASNDALKEFINKHANFSNVFDFLFGLCFIENNRMEVFPLMVIIENEEFFPVISLMMNENIRLDINRYFRKFKTKNKTLKY